MDKTREYKKNASISHFKVGQEVVCGTSQNYGERGVITEMHGSYALLDGKLLINLWYARPVAEEPVNDNVSCYQYEEE